jgi:hypothetical protein
MHVHVTCKYYVYPSKMMDREIKGNKRHFIPNQIKIITMVRKAMLSKHTLT